jgi:hypothetical protein
VEGQAERTESTEKYDPETTERWKQSTADWRMVRDSFTTK